MKKIAIIEDDIAVRDELALLMNNNGYQAFVPQGFDDLPAQIENRRADLVLLDINIPKINGKRLLTQIRAKSNIPVIMVTGLDNTADEATCISYGADDYVTKPYNPTILLLRIAAVLRRSGGNRNIITHRDLTVNLQKGIVTSPKGEVYLTKNEMIIFSCLLANKDRIVTRDRLMTDLWDNEEYVNDNALTVNVSRLRSKLGEIGGNEYIETRKGIGYILI